MLVDPLTSLIQEKYTLTRNERLVVQNIFFGSLERPAICLSQTQSVKEGFIMVGV